MKFDSEDEDMVEVLAHKHWMWIGKLLNQERSMTQTLFEDGFKHGWKHAKEEKDESNDPV